MSVRHYRTDGAAMNEVSANYFREHLKAEADKVIENHDVLKVSRRRGGDFVVLSADDWSAIEETLYLNRIPGLADSILKAAHEPLDDGIPYENLDW